MSFIATIQKGFYQNSEGYSFIYEILTGRLQLSSNGGTGLECLEISPKVFGSRIVMNYDVWRYTLGFKIQVGVEN